MICLLQYPWVDFLKPGSRSQTTHQNSQVTTELFDLGGSSANSWFTHDGKQIQYIIIEWKKSLRVLMLVQQKLDFEEAGRVLII